MYRPGKIDPGIGCRRQTIQRSKTFLRKSLCCDTFGTIRIDRCFIRHLKPGNTQSLYIHLVVYFNTDRPVIILYLRISGHAFYRNTGYLSDQIRVRDIIFDTTVQQVTSGHYQSHTAITCHSQKYISLHSS